MSERYPGGFITKTPVVPTATSAPGIWTLDQAMTYIQAGTWPTPPAFDLTRIVIPYQNTSANFTAILYNWNTNTATAFSANPNFNSGQYSVVYDPYDNIYILSSQTSSTSTNKTIAIILAGTTTINYYRNFTGQFSSDPESQLTWNPTAQKVQYYTSGPYGASSGSPSIWQVDSSGTFTSIGNITSWGYTQADMALLTGMNSVGSISLGSKMLQTGATTSSMGDGYCRIATSPYTSFSGSNLTGNPSRASIVPLSTNTAIVVLFGAAYYYDGSTFTGISPGSMATYRFGAQMGNGMFALYDDATPAIKVFQKWPSPGWTVDISGNLGLASFTRSPIYMFGYGSTLFVVTYAISGQQLYLTRFDFTYATGAVTVTARTLTGYTGSGTISSYRYYKS